MNKGKVLVSLLIAGGFVSPMAHATNGDNMMAVGSQNTALGGTGVANFVGAESTFANPAMLGKSTGREVTGGIVLFKPDVTNTGYSTTATAANSSANTNYIPDVSYSSRISDSLTYGIAMAGIAGMGVDYTGSPQATYLSAYTSLSILKIVPTIAYNKDNYGLGFSPVLQYGSLSIAYDATGHGGAPVNAGHDSSSDTGFGYALGGYYNVAPTLTVAAAYQSQIKMSYGNQLSRAGTGFGQTFADKLDQPAEIKAGVAYTVANNYTLTADYRLIGWGSADGYKQFGWKNQNVVALGAKYADNGYWIGAGYNSADNPIEGFQDPSTTPYGNKGGIVNMFDNLLFPATIKSSFTLGGGYSISKELAIEGSAMYAPKVTTTMGITQATGGTPANNTTTHSQQAYSVSLRYKF